MAGPIAHFQLPKFNALKHRDFVATGSGSIGQISVTAHDKVVAADQPDSLMSRLGTDLGKEHRDNSEADGTSQTWKSLAAHDAIRKSSKSQHQPIKSYTGSC